GGDHAARAAALDDDPGDADAGEQLGAGAQRERDVADVGRALGVGRAAEAAHALAVARRRVAAQRAVPGQPERVAAARDHAAVAAEQLGAGALDVEHRLDALEVAGHAVGAELGEAELIAPAREHAIGRAVARARVDGGGAADGLAERDRDADVADRERRAAAAVQLLLHLERAAGEVAAIEVAALLDEHHREAGLGELAADHRAAGAGADHHDVALDREVAIELVGAIAQVRRLDLAAARGLVDAAELAVQRRVVEVRHLERADQNAQQQPADRVGGAPAVEQLEPPGDREPGERPALG